MVKLGKDSAFFIIYRFLVLIWIFFGLAYIGGLAPLVNELFNNYVYAEIYLNMRHKVAEKVISLYILFDRKCVREDASACKRGR